MTAKDEKTKYFLIGCIVGGLIGIVIAGAWLITINGGYINSIEEMHRGALSCNGTTINYNVPENLSLDYVMEFGPNIMEAMHIAENLSQMNGTFGVQK